MTITGHACAGAETGEVTWAAANGDEINIVFTTVLLAPPCPDGSAPIELQALEVDGTGRFENVQFRNDTLVGTIWFNGPLGLNGHLEAEVDGTIS